MLKNSGRYKMKYENDYYVIPEMFFFISSFIIFKFTFKETQVPDFFKVYFIT